MGYFFNMFNLMNIFVVAGVILVAMVVIGMILARLYRRATKEVSFVRTGFGGQKVILNGGALVLPVLHDTIPVNMNTLRLEVQRANQQALITRDRMRVDVMAEFYVRVKPTQDAIANAAQTLGLKTMNPDELKALVEGKFVDACAPWRRRWPWKSCMNSASISFRRSSRWSPRTCSKTAWNWNRSP